jgi:uncharacterized protein YqjF (DUF2071 family)
MDESSSIDRLAPTRRPAGRAAQRQRWWELLFLHWPVPVAALRSRIPAALEVDTWEGTAYVGLVAFTMSGVRPVWAPAVPGLSSFHEVNVRTYVHAKSRDPGVWFFSLDASSRLAVLVARLTYHLPYRFARMSLKRDAAGEVHYRSERRWPGPRPAGCAMSYAPTGPAAPAAPGTLEHFLAERYVLYAERRGCLFRGRVHHEAYPLQPAAVRGLDESLVAAAGIDRGGGPPLVHYAKGVSVEVFGLEKTAPV